MAEYEVEVHRTRLTEAVELLVSRAESFKITLNSGDAFALIEFTPKISSDHDLKRWLHSLRVPVCTECGVRMQYDSEEGAWICPICHKKLYGRR